MQQSPVLVCAGFALLLSACSPTPVVETQAPIEAGDLPSEPVITTRAVAVDKPATINATPKTLTITATGDMMLGGTGTEFYHRDNYDYAFANVRKLLIDADVFIGNIETSLTTSDELLVEKKYRFRNPPGPVSKALARAGMDIANLANNHSLDYGYTGLKQTRQVLNAQNIKTIGAGDTLAEARRAAIITIDGQRVGFLAYSNTFPPEFWAEQDKPGTAFGHEEHVRDDVQALKAQGINIVVVSFHWGREGTTELRDYQPLLGRAAIDAGAALVIGHHPHVLQAVERYKHGVILYSLGNFTFGSYSSDFVSGAIAQVKFVDNHLRRLELIPIDIFNQRVLFQPTPLQGEQAQQAIAGLQMLSLERGTQLQAQGNRAVLEFPVHTQ